MRNSSFEFPPDDTITLSVITTEGVPMRFSLYIKKFSMLAALSVALSACSTESPAEELQASGTFEALTYNVAGLPQGISDSNPEEFMPKISPLLNTYDLVLVQEDFVYHRDLKRDATHPYQSTPKDPDDRLIADGLNRFSHFTFDTLKRQQWTECYGAMDGGTITGAADCLAEKGFSMARTTFAPGIVVDIYNHHAEAGGGEDDAQARATGYAEFTQFIQANSAGNAVIIGGDTNLHRNDPVDGPLLEGFQSTNELTDACQFLECGTESIDRFLFRNSDTVELTPLTWRYADEFVTSEGDRLSDHYAVHVGFRWDRLATSAD